MSEIHVIKWLHEPTLDKSTHTVYWTIEARDDAVQGDSVNAVAIRLGRAGFERLTFITHLNNYQPVGGPLDLMLRAFSFPAGGGHMKITFRPTKQQAMEWRHLSGRLSEQKPSRSRRQVDWPCSLNLSWRFLPSSPVKRGLFCLRRLYGYARCSSAVRRYNRARIKRHS